MHFPEEPASRRSPRLTASLLALAFLLPVAPILADKPADRNDSVHRESLLRIVEEKTVDADERAELEDRAQALGLPLRRELADGTVLALQGFRGKRPIYYITDNLNAADTISTDEVHAGGSLGLALDGAGETLLEWDSSSARLTHQELTGRVVNLDGASSGTHSSHVAGTMIASGVNGNAKGMAPAADLVSYDFNSDEAEMAAEQLNPDPIKVSNHSYGFITGWRFNFFGDGLWVWFGDVQISTVEDQVFGYYLVNAQTWDQIAYDSPYYLMVKSAGNDRGDGPGGTVSHWHFDSSAGGNQFVMATDSHPQDGDTTGWDTIGGGVGTAKNILTVGAVNDIPGGWTQPSDVVMSSFSGWGPTDDGRIKPDVVANGVSLLSSSNSSDVAYTSLSGTSMSTPNTSGSMALLHQHANNLFGNYFKAATMKGLILHTASEAGNPGPDYVFGWGLVNTAGAADVLSAQAGANPYFFHLMEETLADGNTLEYTVNSDGASPLAVTMAWTDVPGAVPADILDPPDAILVNDLDVRLIGPDSTVYEPWILDPANPGDAATTGDNTRDSVEQVFIATPDAGAYTLQVTHKGSLVTPVEGLSEQDVSLVVTGHFDPLTFADGFESGDTSAWSSSTGG